LVVNVNKTPALAITSSRNVCQRVNRPDYMPICMSVCRVCLCVCRVVIDGLLMLHSIYTV